jgi:glycosyltransferase 2 family protein
VEVAVVWAEIRHANFLLLSLAVAITTGTFFFRALRWKVLLAPIHPGTSLRSRWAAVNIGFMANNLLPARAGEFARAYAMSRLEPVPVTGAFASLVVERFLDGFAIVLFMFLAMAAPGFPSDLTAQGTVLGGIIKSVMVILGLLLGGMILLLLFPRPLVRVAEGAARLLPHKVARVLVDALVSFLDGLKVFQSPRLLLLAVAWSLATWAWQCLAFWVAFRAFGIHVGYDAAMFVNAIVGFAVGVPAAPGFFGTFHAGALMGLGVYGIQPAPTLAFAFGFHLGGFIPVTIIGLYYAWRLGLSVEEVEGSEERVEAAVEESHPDLTLPSREGD